MNTVTLRPWRRALCCWALAWVAANPLGAWAAGPDWAVDVASGQDHPLLQRFTNSWLLAYQQLAFDSSSFPGKLGLDSNNHFLAPVTVEGRITRLVYFAPLGKTPLEVHRNYESALKAAGYKIGLGCTPQVDSCRNMSYGFADHYDKLKEADFRANRARHKDGSPLHEQMSSLGGPNMLGNDDRYFSYGTLNLNGNPVHVMLSTAKVYNTRFTTTYIEIAEPQAMTTGQVTVNAQALQAGLLADGKIALYGIYFDSGKAVLKPESQAQIDQMVGLLKAQPTLKVYLVGHTDNQGSLEANLTLSQQRAQAVVDALVRAQVDAKRLNARGVASLAPVASNNADAGRARNRRVELVLQ
jgi:OmpA-OmpF porin, OOP family